MRIQNRLAIVWLLTGLNLFNYLDRYVVNAVSPRIQSEFCLGDARTGWVISAFMLGYFLTSPIFGALGDRFPRKGLIAAGVTVWSIATIMSGFSVGFLSLVIARICVGVGEASYATLSPTIIDDVSSASNKNRYLAIFYAAIPVGSALGYVFGGVLEERYGWHRAFFVAGAPGLLLAALVLFIDEPKRSTTGSSHGGFLGSLGDLAKLPGYRYTILGYVAYTFALGGFAAWAPKYLNAALGMELGPANKALGGILVGTGFLGTALGGWLADRWSRGAGEDAAGNALRTSMALKVCAIFTAAAAPFAVAMFLTHDKVVFFALIAVTEFFLFVSTAPVNAAILGSAPTALRASAMALSIFAIHLFGDLVSPPAIGAISDSLATRGIASVASAETVAPVAAVAGACVAVEKMANGESLRLALFILPVAIVIGAAFWWRGIAVARNAAGSV